MSRLASFLVLAGACALAQPPLLHYPFDGPVGDGVTTNIGTFSPGPHPLVGHEEDCLPPNLSTAALRGGGGTTHQVTTGFNPAALGAGSWTVGFCINCQPNPSGTALQYVFGGTTNSWRIFSGGVAGAGNLLMRATGLPDTNIIGGSGDNGWVHVAWVYDSAAAQLRGYLNGSLVVSNPVGAFAGFGASTTALVFAKYTGSTASLRLNNCMEDARLYGQALTQAEIQGWVASCIPCLYQLNSMTAHLDVDGLTNTISTPIIARRCPGALVSANINGTAGAGWEMALTVGTTTVPDLQLIPGAKVNINLLHPSLTFLNNLAFPPLVPLLNLPLAVPPVEIDAQLAVLDPAAPAGLTTSAAVCLDGSPAPNPVLPGPTLDDSAVVIPIELLPLCLTGVSWYGTTYTQVGVSSNGIVTFGGTDTTFTPTVSGAQSGLPRLGAWMDLNPAIAGSGQITIDALTPGRLTVNYNNVFAFGTTAGITVRIYYTFSDCSWCIEVTVNTAVASNCFRGGSRGLGQATDPGSVTFLTGMSGLGTPTGMIYEFGPHSGMSSGTLMLTPAPGSSTGANGYDWTFL
jgi:hypothetical protein